VPAASLVEHRKGLSNAGRRPEVNAQLTATHANPYLSITRAGRCRG
jgi:hypothetical protein